MALAISSLLNAIYFIRTAIRIFTESQSRKAHGTIEDQRAKGRWVKGLKAEYVLPMTVLTAANLFLGLFSWVLVDLIQKGFAMVSSKFRYFGKDRKLVRPVCPWSSPAAIKKAEKYEYSTELRLIEKKGAQFKFEASISRGFKHQVRCHLCWCGFPILGDADYNPHAEGPMQFYATGFHFPMPDGKEAVFSIKGWECAD